MSTQKRIKPIIRMRHAITAFICCVLCTLLLFPGGSSADVDLSIPNIGGLAMYEAAYTSDTIADVLTSGSEYPATISFLNRGLAQWRENSKERFGLLYQGGQSSVQINPLFNPISDGITISNGEEAQFSFLIQTPEKPGVYSISFTMAILKGGRYEPFKQTFTRTIKIVPKSGISSAQFGAISVLSAPPLAEIYIGGEYVGRTPFTIADLTPATYRVRVSDSTYGSKEVAVQVVRGSMTEVIFDLIDNEKTRIKTEEIYEYTLVGRLASFAPPLEVMAGIIIFLFFLAMLWIFKREAFLEHHMIASLFFGMKNAAISITTAVNTRFFPPHISHTVHTTSNTDMLPKGENADNSPLKTESKAVNKGDGDDTPQTPEEAINSIAQARGARESELRSILIENNTKPKERKDIASIAAIIDKAHTISSTKVPQAIPDLVATGGFRVQNSQGSSGAYHTPLYEHKRISSEKRAEAPKGSSTSGHQILSILKKSDPDTYIHPEEFRGIQFQIPADESAFPSQLRDQYEPLGILGEDAYARTFKVKKLSNGEIRALKISCDTQPVSEILITEANIWRNMRHASIIKMYASDFSRDLKVIELEYQIGFIYKKKHYISLREIPKPIREKYALSIVIDIAKGLDYAHTLGIRHYHISLGNILIGSDFRAKLSGFVRGKNEFAPAFYYSTINTDASAQDIAHLAPEQRESDAGTLGTQTDMYQLGIIFYELLTGYTPYSPALYEQVYGKEEEDGKEYSKKEDEIDKEELEKRIRTVYIPPSLLSPAFVHYDDIFAKLIVYDKKKRYASIRELLAALKKIDPRETEETETSALVLQPDDDVNVRK